MLGFVVRLSTVSDTPDEDLARRIADGGREGATAEAALCRKFAPRIRVYGRRHLGDDQSVEDLVQLVLVRVIEALRAGRVETPESLGSFVFGTCRYVSWDMHRAEKRQRAILAEALVLASDVPPKEPVRHDVMKLFRCLNRLPERERLVVRMTFMDDRDTDEVARRLGLTTGNVRVVKHRALAKLYDCLEGGGGA
jgi:RNA polymerase sigma-70 factor (ECF subfamily)